ncbi:SufE family protein [Kiloniella sp. b19]|uniref:SufE family protein n=1 Tax=Kiloniella sp. GXU_MW_B19 TaxID=3141326 RepID=UPI0031E0887A
MTETAFTNEDLEDLIDTFEFVDDWEERYRYIIDMGKKLPALDDSDKTEENRVQGCTSQVWLVCETTDATPPVLKFRADSDAHIVRGLVAMMMMVFSGKTAREILDFDIQGLLDRLELAQHLSPNRANGLHSMVERIRATAQQYL